MSPLRLLGILAIAGAVSLSGCSSAPAPDTATTTAPQTQVAATRATANATAGSQTQPCSSPPISGFGRVWSQNPSVRDWLVCAVQPETTMERYTVQRFQAGVILWIGPELGGPSDTAGTVADVIVLFRDNMTFTKTQVAAAWVRGGTEPTPLTPPPGLFEPKGGLGRAWREFPGVRDRLGWATEAIRVGGSWSEDPQRALNGATQSFLNGTMYWIPYRAGTRQYLEDRWVYVLSYSTNQWMEFLDIGG